MKSLAQEVLDIMRKILGVETYTQLFAKTHKEQYDRKETRKRKDAVEVCIQFDAVNQHSYAVVTLFHHLSMINWFVGLIFCDRVYCGIIRFHGGSMFMEFVGTSHPSMN